MIYGCEHSIIKLPETYNQGKHNQCFLGKESIVFSCVTKRKMSNGSCEYCAHYLYDDEYDEYYCDVSLDEDEMEAYMRGNSVSCGFFKFYDEYKMVEKQN